jgi:hypothetical protein
VRFQDGAALVDQVRATALKLPVLPPGEQYEVWLIEAGGEQRRSLGVLALDENGAGTLTFVDTQGRNLLERYDQVQITVESAPDSSPNPSDRLAFSASLPPGGLTHVRHLLVSFNSTPGAIGLVQGLLAETERLDRAAQDLLAAYAAQDEAGTRRAAEAMLNLLVGDQSPDFRDWDGDGQVTNPGDGFGLLLNGDNVGYLEGSYSHADFAVTSADATENMIIHGEHVKITVQNLEQWAPQLRDLIRRILDSPFDARMEADVRQAVALADEMLLGIDVNGDEQIDPIPGEGGAQTAYQHAFYMADILIFTGSQ